MNAWIMLGVCFFFLVPCVGGFVEVTLADAVVIVCAGVVVTAVIAIVIADAFPLFCDVLITGK